MEYIQNDDGSPHDKHKGERGNLPNKVQKSLKKKSGWDYNGKKEDFFSKTSFIADVSIIQYLYADGSQASVPYPTFPFSESSIISAYYGDEPISTINIPVFMPFSSGYFPLFSPSSFYFPIPLVPAF